MSDSSWTTEDARTVCRQLGRDGIKYMFLVIINSIFLIHNIVYSISSPYSGYNDENLPVVMSNVNCLGTESRLIDCSYNTGGSGSPVSLRCTYDGQL